MIQTAVKVIETKENFYYLTGFKLQKVATNSLKVYRAEMSAKQILILQFKFHSFNIYQQ